MKYLAQWKRPQFMLFQVHSELTPSQLTFTCSKSTLETLEKGVNCVQN